MIDSWTPYHYAQTLSALDGVLVRGRRREICQSIEINIDLDIVDPKDAPGVETPVKEGIMAEELINAVSEISNNRKICALEISEFNAGNDVNNRPIY